MSATDDARDAAHNRETIVQVATMIEDVFVGSGIQALQSIKVGSPLTGSPGQPVQSGDLLGSWQMEREGPDSIAIGTNKEYAESIEDGLSYAHGGTPMVLRSEVGGFHSVAHTVAGFDRLVEAEKDRVRRTGGGPNG